MQLAINAKDALTINRAQTLAEWQLKILAILPLQYIDNEHFKNELNLLVEKYDNSSEQTRNDA